MNRRSFLKFLSVAPAIPTALMVSGAAGNPSAATVTTPFWESRLWEFSPLPSTIVEELDEQLSVVNTHPILVK